MMGNTGKYWEILLGNTGKYGKYLGKYWEILMGGNGNNLPSSSFLERICESKSKREVHAENVKENFKQARAVLEHFFSRFRLS